MNRSLEELEARLTPSLAVLAFSADSVTFGQAGSYSADRLSLDVVGGLLTHNLNAIGGVGDYADDSDVDPGPGVATISVDAGTAVSVQLGPLDDALSLGESWPALGVTLDGGVGTDTLDYSAGSLARTLALSGSNAGTIDGGAFAEVENVTLGGGNDVVVVPDGARLTGTLDAGGGVDLLDYSARTSAVRVSLTLGGADGFGAISGVENVTGGGGNDWLSGDNGANVLRGGAGNDVLVGLGGADSLYGDGGRDPLVTCWPFPSSFGWRFVLPGIGLPYASSAGTVS